MALASSHWRGTSMEECVEFISTDEDNGDKKQEAQQMGKPT
jgi:hypothetical protein